MACGARLDAAAQARAVRKTVTAVCCGVPDADAIGASLDPESFDALVRHVHGWASSVLADHGASMAAAGPLMISAVFGIPASHDDDALRAVRAATELHGGLADLNADTQLRWGVSVALASAVVTAEVLAVEGDPAPPSGGAVAAARQLQRLAIPGEILLDSTTQQMVGPAVSVELLASPDPSGPRPVGEYWRLMALESDEVPRRYDVPLVDREAERELLRQRYTQTVTSRACN